MKKRLRKQASFGLAAAMMVGFLGQVLPMPVYAESKIAVEERYETEEKMISAQSTVEQSKEPAKNESAVEPSEEAAKNESAVEPSEEAAKSESTAEPSEEAAKSESAVEPSEEAAKSESTAEQNEKSLQAKKTNKNSKGGEMDNIQSFEKDGWQKTWTVDEEHGSLSTSSNHYKMGTQSMKWDWDNNSPLLVTNENNMTASGSQGKENGGVIAWIYNEEPQKDGKLTFTLRDTESPGTVAPYTWEFNLDFKGWRAMWICFKYDAVNPQWGTREDAKAQNPRFNQMEIVPSAESGSLYFDLVEFVNNMHWCRIKDYQYPHQRTDKDYGRGGTWERQYEYITREPSEAYNQYPEITECTPAQSEAFKTIEERLDQWIFPDDVQKYMDQEPMKIRTSALQAYIEEGKQDYRDLHIDPDTLTGVPLVASRSPYSLSKEAKGSGIKDAVAQDESFRTKQFGADVATEIFLPLYFDYRLNGNQESYDNLITLFRYYHDQGWAEGSGLGTLDHETNRSSGYFVAVYLMRDELKKEEPVNHSKYDSLYDEAIHAMEWYTDFGKVFGKYGDLQKGYKETTSDEMRTHFLYRLLYVLAMEDGPDKVKAMTAYLDWVDNSLAINPNFGDTIKPDYTGYHHRGMYAGAYAPTGYHMASCINYLLHGGEFAMSHESQLNLKNALMTSYLICDQYDLPQSLTGRMPYSTNINSKILPAFAYMAMAGNPETGEAVDKDMAGIFMKLWNPERTELKDGLFPACRAGISYFDTLGGMKVMLDLVAADYPECGNLEGFWTKPYGGLVIHRRDSWVASNKGWSQYVFDFESGGKKHENVYGRYMSYGALQIMAHHNPKEDGYDLNSGWDWNRVPGATTIHLNWEDLSSKAGSLRESGPSEFAHRNFSKETFVGGVTSQGKNGIFSMKMRDDVFHDPAFTANKTNFFFDDEIICLGSDICNDDNRGNTETILFQFCAPSDLAGTVINGKEENGSIDMQVAKDGESLWLTDPAGNAYYIPDGGKVHVFRGTQQSPKGTWLDSEKELTTSGNCAAAWIDHGKQPKDASYEYVIKVQADADSMKNYAESPKTYDVLQQDNVAHVLRHKVQNTTAYAIFNAEKFNQGKNEKLNGELIANTDTPIMAMVKKNQGKAHNEVVLSMCNPDLNNPIKKNDQGMSEEEATTNTEPTNVKVTLNGNWQLKESGEGVKVLENKGQTILEFICRDGLTNEITLIPTAEPTAAPTAAPTAEPTAAPTAEPTAAPTAEPTARPTARPTNQEAPETGDNFPRMILFGVAAAALAGAVVTAIALFKKKKN